MKKVKLQSCCEPIWMARHCEEHERHSVMNVYATKQSHFMEVSFNCEIASSQLNTKQRSVPRNDVPGDDSSFERGSE